MHNTSFAQQYNTFNLKSSSRGYKNLPHIHSLELSATIYIMFIIHLACIY